jgi:uncharacterized phage-associated protein
MNDAILSAQDVARYFLSIVDEDAGDNMTLLKLQKLLYYAQGFYLAMHGGEPLFDEPIEARDNGPAVPQIDQAFKHDDRNPIERPAHFDPQDYPPEVRELLDAVYQIYGQFTAWKLRDLTHQEPPWRDTPRQGEIQRESLRAFFETLEGAGRTRTPLDDEPLWPADSFRHQKRREIMRSVVPRRERLRAILDRVPSPDPWADDVED